ncbi:MAG: hypothetical protein ACLQVJ_29330 [Syntrophobacteraceae bacterium]
MIDYSIYYKTSLSISLPWPEENRWDVFISAYTSAERVLRVFDKVDADSKHWLVLPEYQFDSNGLPPNSFHFHDVGQEAQCISDFWDNCKIDTGMSICVDTTGFIRPYLVFFIGWLVAKGLHHVDLLYSEPIHYEKKERTAFSGPNIIDIRQVAMFEGIHSPDTTNDVLIINAGYEDNLISLVAEYKNNARKVLLLGFPSLRADMYQENVLRTRLAEEAIGLRPEIGNTSILAPAYDPFVTANVLKKHIDDLNARKPITNLYICPLATKPQLIGCTLHYLFELKDKPCSIIFPFSDSYSRKTGIGISRIWKYTLELPL